MIARSDSLPAYKIIAYEKQRDIDSLNTGVAILRAEVTDLKKKDTNNVKIFNLMGEQSKTQNDQLKIAMDQVAKLNRQLKWKEAKEKFLGGIGIAGIVYILMIKK